MDYLAAYSDLESADMAAKKATDAMGAVGQSYYQNNIKPELKAAEARFTSEQKAGRSMYTASATSYDIGSDYIPQTGWNLNHQGERIIPSDQNERITQAIEGGTMPTESSNSGWQGDIHVHAIDSKGVSQFLDKYKHQLRGAMNASYAENSGGSDV